MIEYAIPQLANSILAGDGLRNNTLTAHHADWVDHFREKYIFTKENIHEILQKETGLVFCEVLKHAGVYACTEEGKIAFLRFLNTV